MKHSISTRSISAIAKVISISLFLVASFNSTAFAQTGVNGKDTTARDDYSIPSTAPENAIVAHTPGEIYDGEIQQVVDVQAVFPTSIGEWLGNHLIYPDEAIEQDIQGRVIVRFVVEKDGSVTDVKILRSVHPLLDAEAVRAISTMPKWQPALLRERPVRSYFVLPVSYQLEEEEPSKTTDK